MAWYKTIDNLYEVILWSDLGEVVLKTYADEKSALYDAKKISPVLGNKTKVGVHIKRHTSERIWDGSYLEQAGLNPSNFGEKIDDPKKTNKRPNSKKAGKPVRGSVRKTR